MSRISSYASKLRNRIRQTEVEEDPQSLSVRAFRRRVLDEESEINPLATGQVGPELKVAVYRDRGAQLRRGLLRFLLVIVAPLAALALILLIVLNIVNDNKVAPIVETESVVMANIPVPGGVRPISRARNLNQKTSAQIYYNSVLSGYNLDFKGAATYITAKSKDEIKQFYDSKLVDPKPPPWQIYGKPGNILNVFSILYLRALPNGPPNSLEGLAVQIEPVDQEILRKDPEYYDTKAQVGENVITLWKGWLTLK